MNCIEVESLEIKYLPLSTDYYEINPFSSVISVSDCPIRSSVDVQSLSIKSCKESYLKRKLIKLIRKLKN